ncbi:hypothetical protein CC79DRAFT_530041 [Sarocladium strictum]
MSSTPRLRSGFPATPGTSRRRTPQETPTSVSSSVSSNRGSTTKSPTLPLAPENVPQSTGSEPVIPLTVLDAPQQRLYASLFYLLLWAWKLYDWLQVVEDGDSSWGLFLKWIFIDFIFLFGLPELRIPWLELSQFAVVTIFSAQLVINYMLMFNIPLPWQAWLLGFVKILWDSELSVSEHNVKVSNILNNHSLIMGKQIINILPEGSAVLNPERRPFCVTNDKSRAFATLPMFFNATVPAEIEIVRIDIETLKEEIIKISSREVGRIAKQIKAQQSDPDAAGFQWDYQVKKPGVYRLGKVLDEYKLEVQRSSGDTYVVPCPRARIHTTDKAPRCKSDLSNLALEVTGTPPLKIEYSRRKDGNNHDFHFQSLQPDGYSSPLIGASNALKTPSDVDVAWVQPARVMVSLNESMDSPGEWMYSVDKVYDAFGNMMTYNDGTDEQERKSRASGLELTHTFHVKERPRAFMSGCDLRSPLKVAKGKHANLPIRSVTEGSSDSAYTVEWVFSPIDSLTNSGDHGDVVLLREFTAKNGTEQPRVSEPGLYTLKTISSGSCAGEIDEPSSCLLLNPLEPHMSLRYEEIPDKCAGNSIGLRVDLDLVGTPPFNVRYDVISGGRVTKEMARINGLRQQLELIPKTDGHHKYVFKSISDAVYHDLPLAQSDNMALEQVVKPAASAQITSNRAISACLDAQVEVDVVLGGDAPWTLEWEIVHDGRRKTEKATNIEVNRFKIKTAPLVKGGEYVLALSSVQDKRGCKTFLQDQMKVSVRRQRPRGGFGLVDGKRSLMSVADFQNRVPLKLSGEGPWMVSYRNVDEGDAITTKKIDGANGYVVLNKRGQYEITSVTDKQCAGDVDTAASTFSLDWHPRPQLSLVENESFKPGSTGVFEKGDVCEGDVDGFEVQLSGSSPFHVEYEIKHKPLHGSNAISRRKLDAVQPKAAISLDTSKAGDYAYVFSGLGDTLYDPDTKAKPLTLKQRVNPRPTATFTKPGQTFKYCMEEQAQEDKIPITLSGTAPFHVEIEIKHHGGAAPQTYSIPSINSKSWGIQVPRQHLSLGNQQIRIRRVRDARGCQQKYDNGGPSINIQLFDAPSIYPLESRQDYCVGERIAYTLSGTPPFDITYDFNGKWNAKSQSTSFRRIAEKPGDFTITSVADKASECRAAVNIPKTIHPLPSVQISRGRQSRVDIHEGNEVDISFEFWGTPPFEFTYTRSSNAKKGQKSVVLETRHDVSHEYSKVVKASQEGTYEVVAIKDKFCSFSTQQVEAQEKRL